MSEHIVSVDNLGIGGKRRVVATSSQLQDSRTYQRLKAEAASLGTELEMVNQAEYDALHGREPETPAKPDEDGCVVDSDGNKLLMIQRSQVEGRGGHQAYLKAKALAKELNVELRIE